MYKIIVFQKEQKHIDNFLSLPQKLYTKHEITQNIAEERAIIEETHVLSKYFSQRKILAYNEAGEACGRCVVTMYPDTAAAYIGYFECIEDDACARLLFEKAEECARSSGFQSIIGPLDSSFWLKYRLKIDGFDRPPYIGEPYNKPYYASLFETNGYSVMARWVSNRFAKIPLFSKASRLYKSRLRLAKSKNYKFTNPSAKDFDKTLDILYDLISETFQGFLVFRAITRDDFRALFNDYRLILDYHFVKIVYYNDTPVAFSVTLPDYRNMLYQKLTVWRKIRILLKRLRSGNYVTLYMGAKKEHLGLGRALTQSIMDDLYIRRARSIGALMAKGKFSDKYAAKQAEGRNEYVLFEKLL